MAFDPSLLETILRESVNPGTPVAAGGNSTVAKVTIGSDTFAVKNYSHRSDGPFRQQREWNALVFLDEASPDLAPKPLWCSKVEPVAIHSWVTGSKPELGGETVGAMIGILESLHRSYHSLSGNHRIPRAVDAVDDIQDLSRQISARISGLESVNDSDTGDVLGHIYSQLGNLDGDIQGGSGAEKPHFTLSPSDFGPHNMIYDAVKTKYKIIDLEFFGVDDAHKLVGDTVLHPQIFWTSSLLELFLKEAEAVFAIDWRKLRSLLPYLSLKWATIVAGRIARLDDPQQIADQKLELAQLALFYSDLAQLGQVDLMLSRIVDRVSSLTSTRQPNIEG